MSWTADDRQLVAVCDGVGWSQNPRGFYNSRLFEVIGEPQDAVFQEVARYPELMPPPLQNIPRYYGFGTLTLDGCIYQFLSTYNHTAYHPDGSPWPDMRWVSVKLIYSPDNGHTWCNQDGSTPVVWESWERRSRQTMVFFEEPQDAFCALSILQMGRNYEGNRDGYVYVYASNGPTSNELVMFRVRKERILDRRAYEFFVALHADGTAEWSEHIGRRGVVQTFVSDCIANDAPSVAYLAAHDCYLMVNSGTGSNEQREMFARPSYLGFWVAPRPWGPWRQIHEETAWLPNGDRGARAYSPKIAPKWIAGDGKSFWLVWSDGQQRRTPKCTRVLDESIRATDQAHLRKVLPDLHRCLPYYGFNTQRVDLVVT